MEQALDVYLSSELEDDIKIDRSLALANKALELDGQNIAALNHKATLLFRKKDSEGIIQVADRLIELRPENPLYLGQKAVYLELAGDSQEATAYYARAIGQYQEYLKTDSLNFDLLIEYIGVLEASGDTMMAGNVLNDMKEMNFEEHQKEMLDLYMEQSLSKEQLFKYWKGEIEYDQIGKE